MSVDAVGVVCPECRGEKGHVPHGQCLYPVEHRDVEDCGCPREWQPCSFCGGSGVVAAIRRAVYLARGGPAPVQRRGFA